MDNLIKDDNYVVLQGYMINRLQLKGTDLIVYACIYGFSQEENSWFTGSANYLAKWANVSRRCVMDSLKKLTDLKLIEKKEKTVNGVKYCNYRTCATNFIGYEKFSQGGMKNFHRGYEEFSHHNIEHNIDTYKEEINKEESDLKSAKRIIDYFNEITGKSYKKIPVNTDLIRSRLKDYSEEELCQMIKFMYDKWGNDSKMCDFVRPSTLFRASNCENYVQMSKEEEKEVSDGYTLVGLTYEEQMKIIEQEEKERGKHYWEE